jgi:hypothetical protein
MNQATHKNPPPPSSNAPKADVFNYIINTEIEDGDRHAKDHDRYLNQIIAGVKVQQVMKAKRAALVRELNPSGDQKIFQNLISVFCSRTVEFLHRAAMTYEESQYSLIEYVSNLAPHDYEFGFAEFSRAQQRRDNEIQRCGNYVRERCGPMMKRGVSPDEIKKAAQKFNTIFTESELTEILRDEWTKRRENAPT